MSNFKALCQQLETKIQNAYTEGVTLEDAEKLAGEFLYVMLKVSEELKNASLDARMKKTGVKAVRAAIYLDVVQKNEKKPTEAAIAAMVDTNEVVQNEQVGFDTAEVNAEELERYYQIFREAHVWARGIAKGNYGN